MELETLRRIRRLLSAVVAASAISMVMARVRTSAGNDPMGTLASVAFAVSLLAFILVWRKEHAAAEGSFEERERQQLAAMRLQVELAKLAAKKKGGTADVSKGASDAATGSKGKDFEPP